MYLLSSTHCMPISFSLVNDGYILFWYVFLTKIYTLNSSSSSCFIGSIKPFSFINSTFKLKTLSDVCHKLFFSSLLLYSLFPHSLHQVTAGFVSSFCCSSCSVLAISLKLIFMSDGVIFIYSCCNSAPKLPNNDHNHNLPPVTSNIRDVAFYSIFNQHVVNLT